MKEISVLSALVLSLSSIGATMSASGQIGAPLLSRIRQHPIQTKPYRL